MGNVLLVDGNPDHVRLLSGLFKYRLKPDLNVVGDCVTGLRLIYTQTPDVVLVNALLFASEDYGFPRAISEGDMGDGIGVVVLVSGQLDEIRERAVQQFRATVVELPTSADELKDAMEKAQRMASGSAAPRAVTWQSVDPPAQDVDGEIQPTVHPVSWQAFEKPSDGEQVRPVNWAVDGAGTADAATDHQQKKPPAPKPRQRRQPAPRKKPAATSHIVKEDSETFPPAFRPGGTGFKPIAKPAEEKPETTSEPAEPQPFRPGTTRNLPAIDPKTAKN